MAPRTAATGLLALLASSAFLAASAGTDCAGMFKGAPRSLLMVADPGAFSHSAELVHYRANLEGEEAYDASLSVCGAIYSGAIMGQPVLLVSTGIGPTIAALCTQVLLQCSSFVKEIVYSGTAGGSPQKGGVLNADGRGPNPSRELTRIGDVCVTPLSVNWACQQADWAQVARGYPNVDVLPLLISGPEADTLFGQCVFVGASSASFDLSAALVAAGASPSSVNAIPRPSPRLLASERNFTALMALGTGVPYEMPSSNSTPRVFHPDECSEVDGQFFYSGVPWDMLARNFTAALVNAALGTVLTRRDVVTASAMEGVGVAEAIERHNRLSTTAAPVTFSFVRGISNHLHSPVAPSPAGWQQVPFTRDFEAGYAYAIASYSYLVLSWMRDRCLQASPGAALCEFVLDQNLPVSQGLLRASARRTHLAGLL